MKTYTQRLEDSMSKSRVKYCSVRDGKWEFFKLHCVTAEEKFLP
jgi:hypothetical protein